MHPDDPSEPDPVAEGFRRKAEQRKVTFPGDPAKSQAMAQWMLAMQSGQPIPDFDEWRAAYLRRWEGAPEWAEWAVQSRSGFSGWCEFEPAPDGDGGWHTHGRLHTTKPNLLGSVRCEPRPKVQP
jgi:hypothetical protein